MSNSVQSFNRTEIIRLLSLIDSNIVGLDPNFTNIFNEQLNGESIKTIMLQTNNDNFFLQIKPYIFDALKRLGRLTLIKIQIKEFICENENDTNMTYLSHIEERDLLCSVIMSQNNESLPKLGRLIAKNEYPVPLAFSVFEKNKIDCRFYFDNFKDILSLTNQALAIVSGTTNAISKGKSSIIPTLFNGLHEQRSIFKSKSNDITRVNNVDLVCNEEACEDWVIADFHSEVKSDDAKCLLKAFGAYSTIHILNTTFKDFTIEGSPSDELKEMLKWYKELYCNKVDTSTYICLLIRDYDNSEKNVLELIKKNVSDLYYSDFISIIGVTNLGDVSDETVYKKKLRQQFDGIINKLKRKPIHSICDIEYFFKNLKDDVNFKNNIIQLTKVENDFHSVFENTDVKNLNILPFPQINSLIKDTEDRFKNVNSLTERDNYEKQLRQLKDERLNINPMNSCIKLFINLVNGSNFYSDLLVFEKCLIDFKKDKLNELRVQKLQLQRDKDTLVQSVKQSETKLFHLNGNSGDAKKVESNELKQLEIEINSIENQIDQIDLTIDKFWEEVFTIYDWILEKESLNLPLGSNSNELNEFKQQFNQLIDRFINLIDYGYSIHIIRGRPLKIQSKAMELVFKKLKENKQFYIITIIGEQSSAKSSLLNSLFACDFRTGSGKCTTGIYMNFVSYKNQKIVILDTEGLTSIESSNTIFDNQMTTMAIFSSHLIIINHKGEISSNLERLLGIAFYAKLQTQASHFKPLIMFVLRDQTDRKQASIEAQAVKLKYQLIEQSKSIKNSVDDVMNIDTENIILLPNAFAEDKVDITEVKWRNNLFPEKILNLREKILAKLDEIVKDNNVFSDLSDFYRAMCSFWKIIEDLGDGILSCKDLVELKIRNEIATKCSNLISEFDNKFYDSCQKLIDEGADKINENNFENIDHQTIEDIRILYEKTLKRVLEEYKKLTNVTFYPEDIKRHYESNIEFSFQRIKLISINTWQNRILNTKQSYTLERIKCELIKYSSSLIKSRENVETAKKFLDDKIIECDNDYKKQMDNIYDSDDKILLKIQNCYNENHNQNIFTNDFKEFEITPKINDLDIFINNGFQVNKDDWFKTGTLIHNKFKQKRMFDEIEKILTGKIIYSVREYINKPYVEDSHIKRLFSIIQGDFFNENSSIMQQKTDVNLSSIIHYVLKRALSFMYDKYKQVKDYGLNKSNESYKQMKEGFVQNFNSELRSMQNSHEAGQKFAQDLIENIYQLLKDKQNQIIDSTIRNKLFEILKKPEVLLELAFNKSFKALDYKNVKNITKYCTEVSEEMTKEQINTTIEKEVNELRNTINKLLEFLKNSDFELKGNSKHACIDEIIKLIKEVNKRHTDQKENHNPELFEKCKALIIDGEIKNIDSFNSSFKNKLSDLYLSNYCHEKCNKYIEEIKCLSNKIQKEQLNYLLGCQAACPGCGSKCNLQYRHENSHKSNKHILNGFFTYVDKKTRTVGTEFCWEETFFKSVSICKNDVIYENFEDYLNKRHPDWLSDIKENYKNYVKGKKYLELDFYIKKAWMNTRKAFIYEKKKVKNISDKTYEQDWLNLEEQNNMLPEGYQCDGYNYNTKDDVI